MNNRLLKISKQLSVLAGPQVRTSARTQLNVTQLVSELVEKANLSLVDELGADPEILDEVNMALYTETLERDIYNALDRHEHDVVLFIEHESSKS